MKSAVRMRVAVVALGVLCGLLVGLPWAGRADSLLAHGLEPGSVTVGRAARQFYIHIPDQARGEPAPVIIVLHGGGLFSDAIGARRSTGFDVLADREGFVTVYPNGFSNMWNDGRETEVQRRHGVTEADDVGFIATLISRLVDERIADPERVYVTGMSNGGMMTFRLACEVSDLIAAVAPVIASMPVGMTEACRPGRPVPVLMLNGIEDSLIPWEGGPVAAGFPGDRGKVIAVEDTIGFWRGRHGCAEPTSSEKLPDKYPEDGTRISLTRWSECSAGGEVALYSVEGGGHTWSGWRLENRPWLARLLGPSTLEIDYPTVIWEFFVRHKRPLG